jgi:hypothetical protein
MIFCGRHFGKNFLMLYGAVASSISIENSKNEYFTVAPAKVLKIDNLKIF